MEWDPIECLLYCTLKKCSLLAWRWPFTVETCSRNVNWLYILYHCTDILLCIDDIIYVIQIEKMWISRILTICSCCSSLTLYGTNCVQIFVFAKSPWRIWSIVISCLMCVWSFINYRVVWQSLSTSLWTFAPLSAFQAFNGCLLHGSSLNILISLPQLS